MRNHFILLCRAFLCLKLLYPTTFATPDTAIATSESNQKESTTQTAASWSKFDRRVRHPATQPHGKTRNRSRRVQLTLDVGEGSHRKPKQFRKAKDEIISIREESYNWEDDETIIRGATYTSFLNDVYKNEMSWSQDRNLLLSPVALEVSLAAFSCEIMEYAILKRIVTYPRSRLHYPRAHFAPCILPPGKRFRINIKSIRSIYLKMLQSMTFKSVNVVSNIKTGSNIHIDSYTAQKVREYYNTQVIKVKRLETGEKTAPLLTSGPNGQKITYNPNLIILESALNFQGKWRVEFNQEITKKSFFHGDTSTKLTTFISKTEKFFYVYRKVESYKILELQFTVEAGPFSLLLLLPYGSKSLTDLENDLANSDWMMGLDLTPSYVQVSIPLFSIRSFWDFKDMAREATNLRLPRVGIIQNAFLSVNEWGASSYEVLKSTNIKGGISRYYTGSVVGTEIVSQTPATLDTFVADRPFMFALIHRDEKIILLQGHVTLPNN